MLLHYTSVYYINTESLHHCPTALHYAATHTAPTLLHCTAHCATHCTTPHCITHTHTHCTYYTTLHFTLHTTLHHTLHHTTLHHTHTLHCTLLSERALREGVVGVPALQRHVLVQRIPPPLREVRHWHCHLLHDCQLQRGA